MLSNLLFLEAEAVLILQKDLISVNRHDTDMEKEYWNPCRIKGGVGSKEKKVKNSLPLMVKGES